MVFVGNGVRVQVTGPVSCVIVLSVVIMNCIVYNIGSHTATYTPCGGWVGVLHLATAECDTAL